MRANACEGGRGGFRARATEGVWSLMGLVVEPVFRLLQKTVMEATRVPQRRRGESSDPMVMNATMAIPARMTSERFHIAYNGFESDESSSCKLLPTSDSHFGTPGRP